MVREEGRIGEVGVEAENDHGEWSPSGSSTEVELRTDLEEKVQNVPETEEAVRGALNDFDLKVLLALYKGWLAVDSNLDSALKEFPCTITEKRTIHNGRKKAVDQGSNRVYLSGDAWVSGHFPKIPCWWIG